MSDNAMTMKNKVVKKMDDNIDTDIIYPGRYLNVTDKLVTADHVFELAYPELKTKVKQGEFIVARNNFGCGSSREQAATAIKYSGFGAIIASSFARIFFRNSMNLGLPLITCPEAHENISEGDEIEINLIEGWIKNHTTGKILKSAPLDEKAVSLLKEGGLIPYLRKKHGK